MKKDAFFSYYIYIVKVLASELEFEDDLADTSLKENISIGTTLDPR